MRPQTIFYRTFSNHVMQNYALFKEIINNEWQTIYCIFPVKTLRFVLCGDNVNCLLVAKLRSYNFYIAD